MMQLSRWKVVLVVLATLLSIVFALPNILPAGVRDSLPGFVPKQTVNLGLDLQGGSYLLMEVDTAALRRERMNNLMEDVRRALREEKIVFTGLGQADGQVRVRITDPAQVQTAVTALNRLSTADPNTGQRSLAVSTAADQQITLGFTPEALRAEEDNAVRESIEVVRRRVDESGTKEINPVRQGRNRIVIQAPGVSDPEKLKSLIGKTAKLTFHAVDDSASPEEAAGGRVPPGSMLVRDDTGQPIVVKRRAIVSGEMLTNAQATFDQNQQPAVSISFDSQGARRFGTYTAQNVGRSFAIVLDEEAISVANIIEPIPGGNGQISNMGSVERATELAVLLRAGALPAPLNVEEQRTVTAELGQDAVNKGLTSTIIALVSALVFMVLAYGFLFGGVAVIALLVNGLMIIAAMSSITPVALSLPGIAGLILTLAVAVDANVLIYERMRDEIRAGRPVVSAMDAGFSRAMETILDANITTLAAALIMFFLGAGPVKGFAWTLTIGVFTSVFTAVMITQVLLAWWYRAARPKTLPIA